MTANFLERCSKRAMRSASAMSSEPYLLGHRAGRLRQWWQCVYILRAVPCGPCHEHQRLHNLKGGAATPRDPQLCVQSGRHMRHRRVGAWGAKAGSEPEAHGSFHPPLVQELPHAPVSAHLQWLGRLLPGRQAPCMCSSSSSSSSSS